MIKIKWKNIPNEVLRKVQTSEQLIANRKFIVNKTPTCKINYLVKLNSVIYK